MKCEVIAVGSELLLGQIVDTNSAYIGQALADIGIDSHFQTKVGDNHQRLKDSIEIALSRSDAVIITGGLGPTHDDVTREVIATVLGVELHINEDILSRIRSVFERRGNEMPASNIQQAMIPQGAQPIPIQPGTAAGIVAEIGGKPLYAVPGVPWEMREMMRFILSDLSSREGIAATIASRTLKTWGYSESKLGEVLAEEIERLDSTSEATIALLASGIDGLKVRLTTKAETAQLAQEKLSRVEERVRKTLGPTLIFGSDNDTMESVVLDLCRKKRLSLCTAESLTGGLIAQRLTSVAGASEVFAGAIVAYQTHVKYKHLGLAPGIDPISEAAVVAMAHNAVVALDADISLAVSGVAGPGDWGPHPSGTVFFASLVDGKVETFNTRWSVDRNQVREFTTITALNHLRLRLLQNSI